MKKNLHKTKGELDLMTYEEVMEARRDVFRKGGEFTPDDCQYSNEIDCYMLIRFKDKEEEQFKKWEYEVKHSIGDPTMLQAIKLIVKVGFEAMYNLNLTTAFERVGNFKFIKG